MNQIPNIEVNDIIEAALDILHEAIQHTPIKLSETNGTEYDKGYIFYQDMVVRDVLDNTPKLKQLLTDGFHHQLQKAREEERARIEAVFKEHVPPHAMDLEDSVWLKRLLNKAFGHD